MTRPLPPVQHRLRYGFTQLELRADFLGLPLQSSNSDDAHGSKDRDEPRQGVLANTLNLFRNGAVGFIGWLGLRRFSGIDLPRCRVLQLSVGKNEPDGYMYFGERMGLKSPFHEGLKTRDIKTPKP